MPTISTYRVLLCALVMPFALLTPGESRAGGLSVQGRITDRDSGQPVAGAAVDVREAGRRTVSDDHGRFLLRLPAPGRYTIGIRHIGYAGVERLVAVTADQFDTLHILLVSSPLPGDEIVVRSTRSPSAVTETPFPMHVATGEVLTRTSPVTVADALQNIPGVSIVRDGTWETAIAIRGMSRSNIVSVIDDARIETANDIAGALSLVNIHDLERVEVLATSASALHGTGALGGVVQFVTRRPAFTETPATAAEWTSDVTSVNGGTAQFLSVAHSSNAFAFRVSGGIRRAGNTHTPGGVIPNSQFHDYSVSAYCGVAPGTGQTVHVSYQRVEARDTGIPGGAPISGTSRATYTRARRELFAVDYQITDIAPAIPRISLHASRQEIARNVEIVQSPVMTVTPHASHVTLGLEAIADVVPANNLLSIVGIDAWQRKVDSRREKRNSATAKIIGEQPIPPSSYASIGLFATNEWHIPRTATTLTFGGRVDRILVTNDDVRTPTWITVGGVVQSPTPGQTLVWRAGSTHDQSWSADAGARYAAAPGVDLTALVTTAFRSPSLEERFEYIDLGSIVWVGNPSLQPERSMAGNLGVRVHVPDYEGRVDLFLTRLTNLVAQTPGFFEGRPAFVRTNIGMAEFLGGELEITRQIGASTGITLSCAYVQGRDVRTNEPLPQIPPFSGRIEFRQGVGTVTTATIGTSWEFAQGNLAPGETRTAGWMLLDVGLVTGEFTFCGVGLTAHASVQNALDAGYRCHLSTLRGISTMEPGRNATASLTITL
jgi:hemoglobin/transferrin/lactoferrin receptor protein